MYRLSLSVMLEREAEKLETRLTAVRAAISAYGGKSAVITHQNRSSKLVVMKLKPRRVMTPELKARISKGIRASWARRRKEARAS